MSVWVKTYIPFLLESFGEIYMQGKDFHVEYWQLLG